MANKQFYTTSEVAEIVGKSVRMIQHLCTTGKVDGAFILGKTWAIPEESVRILKEKYEVTE